MTPVSEPLTAAAITGEDARPANSELPPVYPFGDLAAAWLADAEAARAACLAGVPRGPVTGFLALDAALGGYLENGVHVLHGEPGTGKTNLALQIAVQCGAPALFVTTEMSPLVLARRIVARVTGTFLGKLKGGTLSPEAMAEHFAKAAAACPRLAILDATESHADPETVKLRAELWRDVHRAASCLVIVDSLHTWAAGRPAASDGYLLTEYESVNRAVADLQRLAAALHSPVLAVGERNRAGMKDGGQSSARGSGRIEYGVHTVLSLNREEDGGEWKPDAAGEYAVNLKLAKNREGDTGRKLSFRFNGGLASFREA